MEKIAVVGKTTLLQGPDGTPTNLPSAALPQTPVCTQARPWQLWTAAWGSLSAEAHP